MGALSYKTPKAFVSTPRVNFSFANNNKNFIKKPLNKIKLFTEEQ